MEFPLPKYRNLYISKQIDQDSVNAITRDIIAIEEDDRLLKDIYPSYGISYQPKPIKMFIDSFGGSVYQYLGLINIMMNCKTHIHTITTGCAMSAAFSIAICGHRRFSYKDSTFLYHQLSCSVDGTLKEMADKVYQYSILQKRLQDIVLSKTKITSKKLDEVYHVKTDWYMNANEALKLGVIDEIL
jgi:ATP-dependent Clp protease, protease subunit